MSREGEGKVEEKGEKPFASFRRIIFVFVLSMERGSSEVCFHHMKLYVQD